MFSIEFWVVFQLVILLVLIVMLLFFMRTVRAANRRDLAQIKEEIRSRVIREAATRVTEILEPVLKDAEAAAETFQVQINEKNRLIKSLNQRLDSRIISLNLLLNRADACLTGGFDEPDALDQDAVYDQQDAIFEMHAKGHAPGTIAEKLSMPKGEVALVLELKKKFLKMEQAR